MEHRSCHTNLIFFDEITDLVDKGNNVLVFKSFDLVLHDILIKNLEGYKIDNDTHSIR